MTSPTWLPRFGLPTAPPTLLSVPWTTSSTGPVTPLVASPRSCRRRCQPRRPRHRRGPSCRSSRSCRPGRWWSRRPARSAPRGAWPRDRGRVRAEIGWGDDAAAVLADHRRGRTCGRCCGRRDRGRRRSDRRRGGRCRRDDPRRTTEGRGCRLGSADGDAVGRRSVATHWRALEGDVGGERAKDDHGGGDERRGDGAPGREGPEVEPAANGRLWTRDRAHLVVFDAAIQAAEGRAWDPMFPISRRICITRARSQPRTAGSGPRVSR